MRRRSLYIGLFSLLFAVSLIAFVTRTTYAGGPLYQSNVGGAIVWPVGPNFTGPVQGGPLNSQTVDSTGTVLYRVDAGSLGTLSNAQGVAIVDRIFGLYNNISTSSIRFRDAGPILDPSTGSPMDVNSNNFGKVLDSSNPTFQNPIIFDSDGKIIKKLGGDDLVLGEFGAITFDNSFSFINEGFVMLNGSSLTNNVIGEDPFIGVFTHEFAHLAGPLDHEQINGDIGSFGEGFTFQNPETGLLPPGFSDPVSAFDLFAPFTETLFPLLYDAPDGSRFIGQVSGTGRGMSGFFIANLDLDTKNAISDLYPTSDYLASRGSIRGQVFIQTGSGTIPISGIDVVARRISQGTYPPAPGTLAYPSGVTLDSNGIPNRPPAQAATDCLATVSSAVTGTNFGDGTYQIGGLPPGQYLVSIAQINVDFTGGSSIGQTSKQLPLPIPYEYYNGPNTVSSSPSIFVPVTVAAGQTTDGINIVLDGFNSLSLAPINSIAAFNVKQAQAVSFPSEISGTVSVNDQAKLHVIFNSANSESVSNLFKFTVTQTKTFFITLDGDSENGDIDLFLWSQGVNKKKSNLGDPHLIGYGISPTVHEVVGATLQPGNYIIGVAPSTGTVSYKLRIIPST